MKNKIVIVSLVVLFSFLSILLTDVKTVSAQIVIDAVDSGSYSSDGDHNPALTDYPAGLILFVILRNFFVFDLTAVTEDIVAATLTVESPGGYESSNPFETWTLYDVSTDIPTLTAGGLGLTAIYDDLGTGISYGSVDVTASDNGQLITITLNPAAITALNTARGGAFAIGGDVSTLGGSAVPLEAIFLYTPYPPAPVRRLTLYFAEAVPSLNQWGMIVFVVLAGIGAVYYIKRRALN